MEYVQTVLAQVAATRVDDAIAPGGLISDIEAHRDFLASQRGFVGMRITRTANPEGNLLVVVETRWSNNNALADYSSQANNVVSVINRHQDLIVPDSVQVHRMEAVTSEKAEAPTRIYDRLALALIVPIGILAFALLAIYAMSRIYLAIPNPAATVVAAGVALAVLGVAWYFASNPAVPRWQLAVLAIVVVAGLGIGGAAAAIYDEEHKEVHTPETPPPDGPPPDEGEFRITMTDNAFDVTELSVPAGQEITIVAINEGTSVHNINIAVSGDFGDDDTCAPADPGCTTPATILGGGEGQAVINVPAGTYDFRCDFHPDEMTGTLTAE